MENFQKQVFIIFTGFLIIQWTALEINEREYFSEFDILYI